MTAAKAIAAAIGVIVTALTAALADEVLDLNEIGQLLAVVVTAAGTIYGVWKVENKPVDESASTFRSDAGHAGSLPMLIIAAVLVVALLFGWNLFSRLA